MPSAENSKHAMQACLAEYSALRAEILTQIRWRQNLVFASVAASGALFSFALAGPLAREGGVPSKSLALYLIAPVCALIGGLWIDGTWALYRLSSYIREVLSVQANSILSNSKVDAIEGSAIRVLGWESSEQRYFFGPGTRIVGPLVYLGSFVLPGVVSQMLIISRSHGSLVERVSSLELPALYLLNWLFVLAAFGLAAIAYLVKRRKNRFIKRHWLSG